ncbi:ABC transporter substrate-binding protein [Parageobacillus sp. G301]|uniref:ABC transporter substrate-binding protein n=1 Tax=Parageobacillus sp. G301 TaxID=2998290 RepID=UPI002495BF2F|nr:ABC transporter substrate-binding protein [Parageobacillus sp. G301]GLH62973.1 hypothetical protein PG301_08120 [Parageobacillus sp. G301]
MKKKLRKLMISLFIMTVAFSLTACNSNSAHSNTNGKRTIKIGYLPITHALPLYIEKELEKGQSRHFNLELIKFGSWPELMDALNTGRIDGASVLVELAMKAKEQGVDLKAVALGHRDGNVVVTSHNIHSVKDLKGKNFAIPHKFSTHNLLLYRIRLNVTYLTLKAVHGSMLHHGGAGYLQQSDPSRRLRESYFLANLTPTVKHLEKVLNR